MTETDRNLAESVIRLEGKLDAYAAGQNATLVEHGRRLDGHDRQIEELRTAAPASSVAPKPSGWQVAGVIVQSLVGAGSLLGILIVLIQVIN